MVNVAGLTVAVVGAKRFEMSEDAGM